MLQKSIDGHYIRMKWPYFQSLKNIRNTARKALRLRILERKVRSYREYPSFERLGGNVAKNQ